MCTECLADRYPEAQPASTSPGAIERFLTTLRQAALRPIEFGRHINMHGELGPALRLGLFSIIVGQLALFLWLVLLMNDAYVEQVAEVATELGLSTRTYEIIRFGLLPIDALARLGLYALLLQLGVMLTGASRTYRYRDYVRLYAHASVAYLFLLVPLVLGVLLALGYILVICWSALRYHHRLTRRQTFVATVPLALGMLLLERIGL